LLALPSDEFGEQEYSTAEEVKEFVSAFGFPRANFTLLQRSATNGDTAHPIFALGKQTFPGETEWNFSDKYVFGADGAVAERCESVKDTRKALRKCILALEETAHGESGAVATKRKLDEGCSAGDVSKIQSIKVKKGSQNTRQTEGGAGDKTIFE
jgi:hypothetical protein